MNTKLMTNSLLSPMSAQTKFTNTLTRIGYFAWIMSGSNALEPLLAYMDKDYAKRYSDDGKNVLSGVGARFRNWIGVDAYVRAEKANNSENNFVEINGQKTQVFDKPCGVDQMEQMFYDLDTGMDISTASFFDPSVDYKETVKCIDLTSFMLERSQGVLNSTLIFTEYNDDAEQYNEQWAFAVVQRLMAKILGIPYGLMCVICTNPNESNIVPFISYTSFGQVIEAQKANCVKYDCNELSIDFKYFFDMERHLKLQANEETFANPEVAVPMLIQKLNTGLVSKINNSTLKDIANTLLACTIIKHTANINDVTNIYNEQINDFRNAVVDLRLRDEIESFAKYIGKVI